MTRYIKITVETPFCGTQNDHYIKTDMSDEELGKYTNELIQENAEDYDYMVLDWGSSLEDYAEENDMDIDEVSDLVESYYEDCTGFWEEITKEEYYEAGGED